MLGKLRIIVVRVLVVLGLAVLGPMAPAMAATHASSPGVMCSVNHGPCPQSSADRLLTGGVCQPSCLNFVVPLTAGASRISFREGKRIRLFGMDIPSGAIAAPDLPPPKPSRLA